jgi:hypothetical protein
LGSLLGTFSSENIFEYASTLSGDVMIHTTFLSESSVMSRHLNWWYPAHNIGTRCDKEVFITLRYRTEPTNACHNTFGEWYAKNQ